MSLLYFDQPYPKYYVKRGVERRSVLLKRGDDGQLELADNKPKSIAEAERFQANKPQDSVKRANQLEQRVKTSVDLYKSLDNLETVDLNSDDGIVVVLNRKSDEDHNASSSASLNFNPENQKVESFESSTKGLSKSFKMKSGNFHSNGEGKDSLTFQAEPFTIHAKSGFRQKPKVREYSIQRDHVSTEESLSQTADGLILYEFIQREIGAGPITTVARESGYGIYD